MNHLSSWAIRLSLVYLGVAFAGGAWLLTARGFPALPLPVWLRNAHLELALFGWTLQLAMGVAWHILPKHTTQPARGPIVPAVASLVLFNVGIVMVVAAGSAAPALLLLGRLAEVGGVTLFASNAWPRIRAFGT